MTRKGGGVTDDRRSPLAGLEASEALRELPFLAQIGIRTQTPEGRAAAASVLVGSLPEAPNTTAAQSGEQSVLWLGPGEWLVVGPPGTEAALEAALGAALAGGLGAVVDLSANRTTLELRGPHARDVLAKGCALDLHPRSFTPGCCAQTMVGRAAVILEQSDNEPTYRLFVRGSFAGYLAAWLSDGLEEFAPASPSRSSASRRQRSVRATSLNV